MVAIFKKELSQFFSSLTGFLVIGIFLLLMGLFLFVFPDTSILDFGYATADRFFELAPWILLLLVPAIGMRSFSEEFKTGTWELLKTKPISIWHLVWGKYLAALAVALIALLPTIVYIFTIKSLSINGSIDIGSILGSYLALIFLTAAFAAISIWCSALSSNVVIAFLLSAFICYIMYKGFDAVSQIPALKGGADYWIALFGLDAHFVNMSRGMLTFKDLFYFGIVTGLFLILAKKQIATQ